MTVKELIKKLKKCDPKAIVISYCFQEGYEFEPNDVIDELITENNCDHYFNGDDFVYGILLLGKKVAFIRD